MPVVSDMTPEALKSTLTSVITTHGKGLRVPGARRFTLRVAGTLPVGAHAQSYLGKDYIIRVDDDGVTGVIRRTK